MQRTLHYLTVAITITLIASHPSNAQDLPPELERLAASYSAEVEALNKVRDTAINVVKAHFIRALVEAENRATYHGDAEALRAVMEQRQAVSSGDALSSAKLSTLPSEVAAPRTDYIREMARIAQAITPKFNRASSDYLRRLGALETKARQASNQALLEAIGGEKRRLVEPKAAEVRNAAHEPVKRI